jgi:hypothetical protein
MTGNRRDAKSAETYFPFPILEVGNQSPVSWQRLTADNCQEDFYSSLTDLLFVVSADASLFLVKNLPPPFWLDEPPIAS